MIRLYFLCFSILFLTGFQSCNQNTVVSDIGQEIYHEKPIRGKIKKGTLPQEHLTVCGITVDVDSLEDVLRKLGSAPIFKLEGGEESPLGLCYYLQEIPTTKKIVIFSAGPMGSWKTITSIIVASITAESLKQSTLTNCRKLAEQTMLETQSGLKTGITRDQFIHIIGLPPSFELKSEIEFNLEQAMQSNFVTSSGVFAKLKNGRVSWFETYKIISQ